MVEKFNDKYRDVLNESQKRFLNSYVLFLVNKDQPKFSEAVASETAQIKKQLKEVKDINVLKDPELMGKLNEAYKRFVSTNFENATEEKILEVLKYMQLIEDLNS